MRRCLPSPGERCQGSALKLSLGDEERGGFQGLVGRQSQYFWRDVWLRRWRGEEAGCIPAFPPWAGSALPSTSDYLSPPVGLPQLSPTMWQDCPALPIYLEGMWSYI